MTDALGHDVVVITEAHPAFPLVARGVLVDGRPLDVPADSRISIDIGRDSAAVVRVDVFASSVTFSEASQDGAS